MNIIQNGFTKEEIETLSAFFSHTMPPDNFKRMCNVGLTKEEWIEINNRLKERPKFILARPSGETIQHDASSIIKKIDSILG